MTSAEVMVKEVTQEPVRHCDAMGPVGRGVKRLMDIAGALGGMLVFSPLYLLAYVMIKREDNGPAVFSQERIGYGGRPFTLYKFRSMSVKAEVDGVPQLWSSKKWSKEFAEFIIALTADEMRTFLGAKPQDLIISYPSSMGIEGNNIFILSNSLLLFSCNFTICKTCFSNNFKIYG